MQDIGNAEIKSLLIGGTSEPSLNSHLVMAFLAKRIILKYSEKDNP